MGVVAISKMHPIDIQNALDAARVICDTREQPTPRLKTRLEQIGLPVDRKALSFGDYSIFCPLPNGETFDLSNKCVIERKQSADELCQCFTHDRARFEREFERAKDADARVYLLLENTTPEMLYAGKYRSQMKPTALIASLFAWMARYDCRVVMCKSEISGKIIHDILYRELKERLTAYD